MPFLSADIDGDDITPYCQQIAWKPRLNLVDSAIVRFPSFLKGVAVGSQELHVYLDGDLKFSGPIWYVQQEGSTDAIYTQVTAWDHRIYLGKRLAKWDENPGDSMNLIWPCQVFEDNVTAPAILNEFIQNAINDPDVADFDPAGPGGPYGASAPLPLTVGTVDGGGENLDTCPSDFPMTIERVKSLLVATGQLDVMLTPGIGSSELDLLNHYDNDLSGSVVFEYGTGAHNSQIATVTVDMDDMVNALWYLIGERINQEHWKGSITPTAPHPGGQWDLGLLNLIANSRAIYGYMQEVAVHDARGDENTIRDTFEEWWAAEAEVRAVQREFLSIRPQRGLVPDFGVGDRIGVATGLINGGVSGYGGDQIVYGFDLVQDTEVLSIDEIITSADQTVTG